MAMFPPSVPHTFINWLTQPGDVVWDPFSGRGTTALEACLSGRVGYGSDANPLAWVLTGAKADPPSFAEIDSRLRQLERQVDRHSIVDEPDEIKMLFTRRTLGELLWLRSELSPTRRVDRFLLAVLLGSLHANAGKDGVPRGLTVSMPNTFAMAPGYVRRYIDEHALQAPSVDVISFLRLRAERFDLDIPFHVRGAAWLADATEKPHERVLSQPAKLIFTSPPYLQVISYGKFNWIRLWLLGHSSKEVDQDLFRSASLPKYTNFMTEFALSAREGMRDDGYMCLVIGDVRKKEKNINLARHVGHAIADATDLRLVATFVDHLPTHHKVSRIWGPGQGSATKTDRVLMLAGPKASATLPVLPELPWNERNSS